MTMQLLQYSPVAFCGEYYDVYEFCIYCRENADARDPYVSLNLVV